MKADAGSEIFEYNADYWDTANTVGTAADDDAKLDAFNTFLLNGLRVCTVDHLDCYDYLFNTNPSLNALLRSTAPTALELFSTSSYINDTKINQEVWDDLFGQTAATCGENQCFINGCSMGYAGFNTMCPDGNRARWGYCDNLPTEDCLTTDSDRAIGIGLQGASAGLIGVGQDIQVKFWLYGIGGKRKKKRK